MSDCCPTFRTRFLLARERERDYIGSKKETKKKKTSAFKYTLVGTNLPISNCHCKLNSMILAKCCCVYRRNGLFVWGENPRELKHSRCKNNCVWKTDAVDHEIRTDVKLFFCFYVENELILLGHCLYDPLKEAATTDFSIFLLVW